MPADDPTPKATVSGRDRPSSTMPPAPPNRRPVIEIAPGGPYLVHGVETLIDTDMALCRCGHSSAQPFCDGAHAQRDFVGELQQEFPARREYTGRDLRVHYNRAICAHVGYCTARLGSVFNVNARP